MTQPLIPVRCGCPRPAVWSGGSGRYRVDAGGVGPEEKPRPPERTGLEVDRVSSVAAMATISSPWDLK